MGHQEKFLKEFEGFRRIENYDPILNPKYRAIEAALMFARGDDITDGYHMRSCIESAKKCSEMPLSPAVIDHIQAIYRKNEPRRKYRAIQTALESARRGHANDKSEAESWLNHAQEHSEISLSQTVIDHVSKVYVENESRRNSRAIVFAYQLAGGNCITDHMHVESQLREAEEHGPLERAVRKHVWEVYRNHEPERREEALKTARTSTTYKSMKSWLGYAVKHSTGLSEKLRTFLFSVLTRARYKLKPVMTQ